MSTRPEGFWTWTKSCYDEKGFSINLLKCKWGVQETDFLGHWHTPHGIKPWDKKVRAILHMDKLKAVSELCSILGLITYYQPA